MGSWDRKDAEILANALEKLTQRGGQREPWSYALGSVLLEVNYAAKHIQTTSTKVTELRGRVCKICRSNDLFVCDVPDGWSAKCALIAGEGNPASKWPG